MEIYWIILEKFNGYNEDISKQLHGSWQGGTTKVFGVLFQVNQKLLSKVMDLPILGETIGRDNHSLKSELMKFCRGGLELPHEKQGVALASLPEPWLEVAFTIMQFITLDTTDAGSKAFILGS